MVTVPNGPMCKQCHAQLLFHWSEILPWMQEEFPRGNKNHGIEVSTGLKMKTEAEPIQITCVYLQPNPNLTRAQPKKKGRDHPVFVIPSHLFYPRSERNALFTSNRSLGSNTLHTPWYSLEHSQGTLHKSTAKKPRTHSVKVVSDIRL